MGPVVAATTPAESDRSRKPLLVGVGLLVVAALVAAFVAVSGDDDEPSAGGGAGEIFLEPVSFTSDAPFTDSIDEHNAGSTSTTAPVIPTTAPPDPQAQAPTRSVPGAWPGLYGGTRNNAACDAEQLITFLGANPEKARAWGGVLGVAPAEIPAYVRSLTPVVLQRDTRVTNHGFRNGRATPLQSVLQAGTAVLVDSYGVPRVKCGCGNPLLEPTPVATTPRYTGDRWPSFSPANVINVTIDVEVPTFVLVDLAGGEPFKRPPGTDGSEDGDVLVDELCDMFPDDPACGTQGPGGDEPVLGTGDVQVTLRWQSTADLDLAVTDPTGATVDYGNQTSPSGGTLDVDSNAGCSTPTTSPVENVFWPTGGAPDGQYTIAVTYFDVCPGGEGPQPFELTFLVNGGQAAIVPVALQPQAGSSYQVQLVVAGGHVAVSPLAAGGRPAQTVTGTLDPGGQATYTGGKGPGFGAPETTAAPDTTAPHEPGSGTTSPAPAEPDCSQYEEGSMMRILCEHDPTTSSAE